MIERLELIIHWTGLLISTTLIFSILVGVFVSLGRDNFTVLASVRLIDLEPDD